MMENLTNWVFRQGEQQTPYTKSPVMAWARDARSGKICYIMELGPERRGKKCNCTCIGCRKTLVAVNVAKSEYIKRPHFRHETGQESRSCLIDAAREAVRSALREDDIFVLPFRRREGTFQGLSGKQYTGWAEHKSEPIKLGDVKFEDSISALLTLDDGRQLRVHLTGDVEVNEISDEIQASIALTISDSSIAGLSPEEIRNRLTPLWEGACWLKHWHDQSLDQEAGQASVDQARVNLDWDDIPDNDEFSREQRHESLLHREVKAILERHKRIRLPSYGIQDAGIGAITTLLFQEKTLSLTAVALEKSIGNIRPDVLATTEEAEKLLVEITVTNGIDDDRLNRIREAGISAVEIDLSRMSGCLTREELADLVVDGIVGKRWLFHVDELRIKQSAGNALPFEDSRFHPQSWAAQLERDWNLDDLLNEYLRYIESHAAIRVSVDSGRIQDTNGAEEYELTLVQEAASSLSMFGFTAASDEILFHARGSIIERLLSIKYDRVIGYDLMSTWQVINTMMQERSRAKSWHTLYLIAIKVYRPGLSQVHQAKVEAWREQVLQSIREGNQEYLRSARYDDLLALLFPEMAKALTKSFGTKGGLRSHQRSLEENAPLANG